MRIPQSHGPKNQVRRGWMHGLRIGASVLILAQVLPTLTFAFEAATYGQPPGRPGPGWASTILEHGEIVGRSESSPGRQIILIQDLHCLYSAQSQIASLLAIAAQNGIRLVGVEGDSTAVDVSVLSSFPNPTVRRSTADYFMRRGYVSGAEFAAILKPGTLELQGVEDPRLYAESRAAVAALFTGETVGTSEDLLDWLDSVKQQYYSQPLHVLEHLRQGYQTGRMAFKAYSQQLVREAKGRGMHPPVLRESPEGEAEAERLWRALFAAQAMTPQQRQLRELDHLAGIAERLLTISATVDEVREWKRVRTDWSMSRIGQELRRLSQPVGIEPLLLMDLGHLDQAMAMAEQFYALADQRSGAMVERLAAVMDASGEPAAVLIAGGFHAGVIEQACLRKGISLLTVRPRIGSDQAVNPYFSILQNRRLPIEKLLARREALIKPASHFYDPLTRRAMEAMAQIQDMAVHVSRGIDSSARIEAKYRRDMAAWPRRPKTLQILFSMFKQQGSGSVFQLSDSLAEQNFWVVLHPRRPGSAVKIPVLDQQDVNSRMAYTLLPGQQAKEAQALLAAAGRVPRQGAFRRMLHAGRRVKQHLAGRWSSPARSVKRLALASLGALALLAGPLAGAAQAAVTVVYTVAKHDWLEKIAHKLGVTVPAIQAQNPLIKNPDLIFPGDTFRVVLEQGNQILQTPVRHARGMIQVIVDSGVTDEAVRQAHEVTQQGLRVLQALSPPALSGSPAQSANQIIEAAPLGWWDSAMHGVSSAWASLPPGFVEGLGAGVLLMAGLWVFGKGLRFLWRRYHRDRPRVQAADMRAERARANSAVSSPWGLLAKMARSAKPAVQSLGRAASRMWRGLIRHPGWAGFAAVGVVMGVAAGPSLTGLSVSMLSGTLIGLLSAAWRNKHRAKRQAMTLRETWVTLALALHLWQVSDLPFQLSVLLGFWVAVSAVKLIWVVVTLWRAHGRTFQGHADDPVVYWEAETQTLQEPLQSRRGSEPARQAPFFILSHGIYAHATVNQLIDWCLAAPVFKRWWRHHSVAEYQAAAEQAQAAGRRLPAGYFFWNRLIGEGLAHAMDLFFFPAALVRSGRLEEAYGWIWTILYLSVLLSLLAPAVTQAVAVVAGIFIFTLWVVNFYYIKRFKPSGKLGFSITDALWSAPTKLTFAPVNVGFKLAYELVKGTWKFYLTRKTQANPPPLISGLREAYGTGMVKLFVPMAIKLVLGLAFPPQVAMIFAASWSIGSGGYVLFDSGPRMYYYAHMLISRIHSRVQRIPGLRPWRRYSKKTDPQVKLTNDNVDQIMEPVWTLLQAKYPALYPDKPRLRVLPPEKLRWGQGLNTVGAVGKDGILYLNPEVTRLGYDGQSAVLKYLLDVASGRSYYAATLGEYLSLMSVVRRFWRMLTSPSQPEARRMALAGAGLLAVQWFFWIAEGTAATERLLVAAAGAALVVWGRVQAARRIVNRVVTLDGPGTFHKHQLAVMLARRYGWSYINVEHIRRGLAWRILKTYQEEGRALTPELIDLESVRLHNLIRETRVIPEFHSRTGQISIEVEVRRSGAPAFREQPSMDQLLSPAVKQTIKQLYEHPDLRDYFIRQTNEILFAESCRRKNIVVVGHRRTAAFKHFETRARQVLRFYVLDHHPKPSAPPHPDSDVLDMRYLSPAEAMKRITASGATNRVTTKTMRFRDAVQRQGDAWIGLAGLDGLDLFRQMVGRAAGDWVLKTISREIQAALDSPAIRKINGRRGIREMEQFGPSGRAAFLMDPRLSAAQIEKSLAQIKTRVERRLVGRFRILRLDTESANPGRLAEARQRWDALCRFLPNPDEATWIEDPLRGSFLILPHETALARALAKAISGAPAASGLRGEKALADYLGLGLQPLAGYGQTPAAETLARPLPWPELIFGMTRAAWIYDPETHQRIENARQKDSLLAREMADWVSDGLLRARYFLERARINKNKKIVVDSGKRKIIPAASQPRSSGQAESIPPVLKKKIRQWQKGHAQNAQMKDADGHPLYAQEAPWVLTPFGLGKLFRERLGFVQRMERYAPGVFVSRAPPEEDPAQKTGIRFLRAAAQSVQMVHVDWHSSHAEGVRDSQWIFPALALLIEENHLADLLVQEEAGQALPVFLDQLQQAMDAAGIRNLQLSASVASHPAAQLPSDALLNRLGEKIEITRWANPDKTIAGYAEDQIPVARESWLEYGRTHHFFLDAPRTAGAETIRPGTGPWQGGWLVLVSSWLTGALSLPLSIIVMALLGLSAESAYGAVWSDALATAGLFSPGGQLALALGVAAGLGMGLRAWRSRKDHLFIQKKQTRETRNLSRMRQSASGWEGYVARERRLGILPQPRLPSGWKQMMTGPRAVWQRSRLSVMLQPWLDFQFLSLRWLQVFHPARSWAFWTLVQGMATAGWLAGRFWGGTQGMEIAVRAVRQAFLEGRLRLSAPGERVAEKVRPGAGTIAAKRVLLEILHAQQAREPLDWHARLVWFALIEPSSLQTVRVVLHSGEMVWFAVPRVMLDDPYLRTLLLSIFNHGVFQLHGPRLKPHPPVRQRIPGHAA